MATRRYVPVAGRNATASTETRILDAAERFVVDGTFHETTVQQIAEAAGTSRATVFGRLGSKLGVLEALSLRCAGGPEMGGIRDAFALADPVAALDAVAAASCVLWERQGSILRTLKAISILEPEAGRLIEQQRADQHSSLQRLVRRLGKAGTLRPGLSEPRALATLHVATSVETFVELRHQYGLSFAAVRQTVGELARSVLG
jgi:AcrR family transcriptional regulator